MKKTSLSFPLIEEVKDVIKEEWEKVDRKVSPVNRFNCMYPFKTEDMHSLETPPLVDAAVMRLACHVTLPMDDAVSFKDPLDRRMDPDIKRAYIAAGNACRPLTYISGQSHYVMGKKRRSRSAIRCRYDHIPQTTNQH